MKQCSKCKEYKEESEFGSNGGCLHPRCKACRNSAKRLFKATHPDAIKEANKKWAEKLKWKRANDAEYRKKQSIARCKHQREKTESDVIFKLKRIMRNRTTGSLLIKSWKPTTHLYEYIGCTIEELKLHLEKQFTDGMTWENHGLWHIDHIIPLSSAATVESCISYVSP
jgi:hypothetical protein